MKRWLLISLVASLSVITFAQAPEIFRYQGRLVDGTTLVNASLPMSFKLYDAPTGGSLLYEDSSSVLVVDGLYATDIGDDTVSGSLTDALTNTAVYLELTIDGETLSPREQLASVPYALQTHAGSTPSGTIVLTATHPNTELTTKGYSLYYEDVTEAYWKWAENSPYLSGSSGITFSFGKQFGIYGDTAEGDDLYLTEDGEKWEGSSLPIYASGYELKIEELNEKLYFFNTMGGSSDPNACSTTDLQTWNTWTNYFGGSEMYPNELEEIVVFKNALWAFVRNPTPTRYLMRSTDGINWTPMSVGSWGDLNMYGNVVADDNKIWVSSQDPLTSSNLVWSSSDGISWKKSSGSTPSYMETPDLVAFDNSIWTFIPNMSGMPEYGGECWRSYNDGDSWTQVSTNVPGYTGMYGYKVIEFENKLWLYGQQNSGTTSSAIMWSSDGIVWNNSRYGGGYIQTDYASLLGLPNGRLWFYSGDSTYGTAFYFVGGPKEVDGLYFYQKD